MNKKKKREGLWTEACESGDLYNFVPVSQSGLFSADITPPWSRTYYSGAIPFAGCARRSGHKEYRSQAPQKPERKGNKRILAEVLAEVPVPVPVPVIMKAKQSKHGHLAAV